MKIKKFFQLISILFVIAPICMLLLFNVSLKDRFDSYNITNYIIFSVIEILNIVFVIIFFVSKEKIRKLLIVLYIAYLIVTFLIPVFHLGYTYPPTGPNSELMGLCFEEEYRDVYGVDITELEKIYSDLK